MCLYVRNWGLQLFQEITAMYSKGLIAAHLPSDSDTQKNPLNFTSETENMQQTLPETLDELNYLDITFSSRSRQQI